jgi:hypothetical protein
MRYMFLIYGDPDEPDTPALMERYQAFTRDVADAGALRDSAQLQRAFAATTVRVRDGRTLTTDGPYAETREQIGGYYVLECGDLDEAIETAARIPTAADGAVEVRPFMDES